jgi:hypothetical protein
MFIDPNKTFDAKVEQTSVCSSHNKPEFNCVDDNDLAEGEQTSVCSSHNKPGVAPNDDDIADREVEQTSVCSSHNKLISAFIT